MAPRVDIEIDEGKWLVSINVINVLTPYTTVRVQVAGVLAPKTPRAGATDGVTTQYRDEDGAESTRSQDRAEKVKTNWPGVVLSGNDSTPLLLGHIEFAKRSVQLRRVDRKLLL